MQGITGGMTRRALLRALGLAGLAGLGVDMGTFTIGGLLSAFVGAVILLVVFRALTHRGMIHT